MDCPPTIVEPGPLRFKKREIPWNRVVGFHKEIARRAEQDFFALPLGKVPSDRWSSITNLVPVDFGGDWAFTSDAIQSNSFRNLLHSTGLPEAFVGGPSWVRSKKEDDHWSQQWCPFFYRAIRLDHPDDSCFEMVPEQGDWEISPIVLDVLDKKGFLPRKPFEELIPEILECASAGSKSTGRPLTDSLVAAICRELPDFCDLFAKPVDPSKVSHVPTHWVLFSPPPTGPLTQHLVRDYDKLAKLLDIPNSRTGGLALFEGSAFEAPASDADPTPIVPLNDSQRAAVKGILESRPVTVISGPPGCGKSQVVLSVMLNAWQRGYSVLFASNNNQAVDVVRQRLLRFEGQFPIAIRAGSRKKSNVIEALADTLNFITGKKHAGQHTADGVRTKRDALISKQKSLKAFLDSKLPQQVDESVRSALGAYATFQQTLAQMRTSEATLNEQFQALNISASSPDALVTVILPPLEKWLERLSEYESLLAQDNAARTRLFSELSTARDSRDRAVQRVGIDAATIESWSWLRAGPGPELLQSWLNRFAALLAKPLDQHLASYDWVSDYEMWENAESAQTWAATAKQLVTDIRLAAGQLAPKIAQIEDLQHRHDAQRSRLAALDVPAATKAPPAVLSQWSAAYALETSLPPARADWFPWSDRKRAHRQMRRAEKSLRAAYPLTVWRSVGKLNASGRDKLASIVEQTQVWLAVESEWENTGPLREDIESVLAGLRGRCAELISHDNVPTTPDLELWQQVAAQLTQTASCAEKAAMAWRKRVLFDQAATDLRSVTNEFFAIASGVPMKETWLRGPGKDFQDTLTRLRSTPSPETVVEARSALYTDSLTTLIQSWQRARDAEISIQQHQADIENLPSPRRRCDAWKAEAPRNLPPGIDLPSGQLPAHDHHIFQLCAACRDWTSRWKTHCKTTRPTLQKRSEEEYGWAVEKLKEATDLLPGGDPKVATHNSIKALLAGGDETWETASIQSLFESYSPDRIKSAIAGLESQIEQLSFDLAKADWLARMVADTEIQHSLDALHTHYRMNGERIESAAFPLFQKALEAVPIWITTAQSPQSIPMLPDLFDLLIVDEATQCTVTNILPLIYRAKRIAVIGDKEQLPAIPNIGPAAESALAAKFEIDENLLDVVGHAENSLYSASVRALPGGLHEVVSLEEHYRSHPLIIGFSNRHVYRAALKLRTDPANVSRLPFGSAVHGEHVSGHCQRGPFNSSWQNPPEAQAVCELVQRLRQAPEAKSCTLGIVTPFRAQMDAIADLLKSRSLLDRVTVGTAHTYQGDERDIMIFSPVVAKGIGDGAANWVETPRNLINVAVTRARHALFVVADFDICRGLTGILGELVKYVDTVDKLRKTSSDELELFSWMVVQGWDPRVHHVECDTEIDFVLTHEGKRLAIEVDGPQHELAVQQDRARDAFLRGMGYDVLRVKGREVRETPSLVIKKIADRLSLPL